MKWLGILSLIIGLAAISISFSISHITGLIVCVVGFCLFIIGTILLFKQQPKRTNRYF
ncbi:hypothetical protein [Brochothrix campestris]|uniref:hypothetical protein n=1 Tax=Brochothrix campestris TaxID=2757 RepID=UPI0012EB9D3A|nr:hypothetical protein [Brochothrix campestris]